MLYLNNLGPIYPPSVNLTGIHRNLRVKIGVRLQPLMPMVAHNLYLTVSGFSWQSKISVALIEGEQTRP